MYVRLPSGGHLAPWLGAAPRVPNAVCNKPELTHTGKMVVLRNTEFLGFSSYRLPTSARSLLVPRGFTPYYCALQPHLTPTDAPPARTHQAPIKLCDRYYGGVMEAPGQEVVLLSKVRACRG
jgi:hypothetical protein